jgi:hypothetical protein
LFSRSRSSNLPRAAEPFISSGANVLSSTYMRRDAAHLPKHRGNHAQSLAEEQLMRNSSLVSAAIGAAFLVACLGVSPAMAAANSVSYVSGKGSDAGPNSCASPTTPCRSFAHALTQTKAAGEIKTLDPSHYGPLTIDKSITITGVPGAGIRMVNAGDAIVVNASNAVVNLRGIEIDGQGLGTVGVAAYYARALNIVDCVVRRFLDEGVAIHGGWDGMSVTIADSVSSGNGKYGVDVVPGQKPVEVFIDHVTTNDNGIAGVRAYPNATVTITDSFAENNASVGYLAVGGFPIVTTMSIGRSVATGNPVGVQNINAAVMQSFGDNAIIGNATNVSGSLTLVAHK